MNTRELMIEMPVQLPPQRVLEDLSATDALRRMPPIVHSIAEIVAHMTFWQRFWIRRLQAVADPIPSRASEGWPGVTAEAWPDARADFLGSLEEAVALGEEVDRLDDPVVPPVEFPPLARYSRHDALVHVAAHNAHHYGQVVILRQLMGRWPPPAGGLTW